MPCNLETELRAARARIAELEEKLGRPRPRQRAGDTCCHGHLLTEDNIIVDKHGYVRCRTCHYESHKRSVAIKRKLAQRDAARNQEEPTP